MIRLTRHAMARAHQRHGEWSEQQLRDFAELALSCGLVSPGHNGCRRYRFLGKEFVMDERRPDAPTLVTVI
jgi:hypothetical protein